MSRAAHGLYLQIYPSTLEGASRMLRIGRSIHTGAGMERTELVGVLVPGLPRRTTIAEGVDVVRVAGTSRSGNLGRVLRALLWQPRVFARYRRSSVEVVACHNVWILPMCWLLSRRTGAALVYNPHELETEAAAMRGLKKKAAQTIERLLVRRCAVVSVVNAPIAQWYAQRYGISLPVVVGNVPAHRDGFVDLRAQFRLDPDRLLYVHTGNLTAGRSIPRLLAAFARSEHHLLFLGDGPLRPEVEAATQARHNIHWRAPVASEEIVAHMRGADVGLCLIETDIDLSKRLSSPNKLTESLAAATPVLCSDLAEARRILGPEAETWVLKTPDDLEDALSRITKSDVAEFRKRWTGVPEWADEVSDLVDAYRDVLARRPQPDDQSRG